jgi:hypothetical protein
MPEAILIETRDDGFSTDVIRLKRSAKPSHANPRLLTDSPSSHHGRRRMAFVASAPPLIAQAFVIPVCQLLQLAEPQFDADAFGTAIGPAAMLRSRRPG